MHSILLTRNTRTLRINRAPSVFRLQDSIEMGNRPLKTLIYSYVLPCIHARSDQVQNAVQLECFRSSYETNGSASQNISSSCTSRHLP